MTSSIKGAVIFAVPYAPIACGVCDYTQTLARNLAAAGILVRETSDPLAEARCEDIFHLQYPAKHFGYSPEFLLTLLRLAWRRVRIIETIHEYGEANPLRKLIVRAAMTFGDCLLSPDTAMQQRFPGVIPTYVGSSLPSDTAPTRCRKKRERSHKVVRCGIFGAVSKTKAVDVYGVVCEMLAEAVGAQGYSLAIETVGDDEWHSVLRKHGLTGTHYGYRSIAACASIIENWDCSLLFYTDGWSFRRSSLAASLHCGVPVLTNAGRSTPKDYHTYLSRGIVTAETLGHASLQTTVAMFVERLLADGWDSAPHANGLLPEQCTWDAIVAQHIAVYRNITA